MQRPRLKPQGLTILELFTTMVVLASLFLAFVSLFYALDNYSKKSYRLLTASDEAYNKLLSYSEQRIRQLPVESKNRSVVLEDFSAELPDTIPMPRSATVTISPLNDAPQLSKIDIQISYPEGSRTTDVHYAKIIYAAGVEIWNK